MTSKVFVTVSNYKNQYARLNTGQRAVEIDCTRLTLVRCLITVGSPSFVTWKKIRDVGFARALYTSYFEKLPLVHNNVTVKSKLLCRHKIFDDYDIASKQVVSYNLGMAFAKFYSERLFSIPSLCHLEILKKQDVVRFSPQMTNRSSKEPDLVGKGSDNQWHLFEAKGVSTTEHQLPQKIRESKEQLSTVSTVHGSTPETSNACATYLGKDRIYTRVDDPPSGDGTEIEFTEDKFFPAYYAPFLLAENELGRKPRKESIEGVGFHYFSFRKNGRQLKIGLTDEVLDYLYSNRYDLVMKANVGFRRQQDDGKQDRYSVGLDGFVIGYDE